ncbi:N-alpha-acetyltransferase 15, NatA auxiliary subunit [Orchesella cincta]|uniref:N-alpha-acetyltransferase 15, NatA auxiliary subunit n=1 Tax=Orchesella cincta TaxID=48709 RepID=A0A1D2MZB9_ORCCI|nr:N-alpha-acetyltransferase 15, NatA auxiliary subunit [Orchesella cincta]
MKKCYEHKLYKNGLKFAKQILSQPQFADHAETLAMKGLILNALGRRAEATELVRKGLKNNIGSSTCWHVYGLIQVGPLVFVVSRLNFQTFALQRSEKKYDEAIKCFRNALKWDPSNLQILRELSLVQIHTRDLYGFRDTRHQLFKIKPTQRASWLGFAISYHLLKDYDMAYKIVDAFTKSCYRDFQPEKRDAMATFEYEKSELYLYQSMILFESGDVAAARKHLLDHSKEITDKMTYYETIGQYHLALEEYGQAESVYRKLISFNTDNRYYYDGLIKSLRIEDGTTEKVNVYKEIQAIYPKAGLPKRLPLDCVDGDEFEALLEPYIVNALFRGAVTLFTDLEPLYKNPQKIEIIESLMLYIVDNMEKCGKFEERDAERAPVTSLLWAYYYLAKHYDRLGQTKTALQYVDTAIEHTPTLNDLFICKSKIHKHADDYPAAVESMNEARDMDTADRYINSKCAKYMLRANRVDEATEVLGKFTREGANPMENLNEMQCMWFLTETAAAYQRQGMWGEALKKCIEIERHFNDILDDQYDFHTYCIRKMTLRSYVKLLRLEDVLHAHPFYFKAAKIAIDVYLYLYDNPLKSQSSEEQLNTDTIFQTR